MKKEKGFTLIELMAVIIILAVMVLIVTSLIIGSIKESKEKLYETQLENIKSAAKSYMIDLELESANEISLTLGELKKVGYVKKDIKNPKTGEQFNNCLMVSVTRTGELYQYEINDSEEIGCDETSDIVMLLFGSINETVTINKPYIEPGVMVKNLKGQSLDSSKIKVEIKQKKDGNIISKTGKYTELENLIDTSDYYNYEITYIYDEAEGKVSKTRNVTVKDANNLQCLIVPTVSKNQYGWVTKNREAKIYSINSNKKVQYSISTTGEVNYSTNQIINVGSDGEKTIYGYIKDKDGNIGICQATIKYEVGNPSCNINLSGTKSESGWYTSKVGTSLTINNIISPIESQGMSLNSNTIYNGLNQLDISDDGNYIVYGFVKDKAGKEISCQNHFNMDKTTTVKVNINGVIEGTTDSYTSGKWVNKNVKLISYINPSTTQSGYTYQWYKDGVTISGATYANYMVEAKDMISGEYQLVVTTGSGIIGYSNKVNVKIDQTPPTVTYNIAGGVYSEHKKITVTADDANLDSMHVRVYKDNVIQYQKSVSDLKVTSFSVSLDLDSDGTWVVYTQAYDKAGNRQNQSPDDGGWYYQIYTIDTLKPTATIKATNVRTKKGINSGTWSDDRLNISFTSGNGATIIKYCIDTNNQCIPNTVYTGVFEHGTYGTTYIRYQAFKQVGDTLVSGNINAFQSMIDTEGLTCGITLDGTKGRNSDWYITDVIARLSYNPGDTFNMSSNFIENYAEGGVTYGTTTNSLTFSKSSSEQQNVYGYVQSVFGQHHTYCSSNFKIDKTAPEITNFTLDLTGGKYYLSSNVSDDESGVRLCYFYKVVDDNFVLLDLNSPITITNSYGVVLYHYCRLEIESENVENYMLIVDNNASLESVATVSNICSISDTGTCSNGTQVISNTCTNGYSYEYTQSCQSSDSTTVTTSYTGYTSTPITGYPQTTTFKSYGNCIITCADTGVGFKNCTSSCS